MDSVTSTVEQTDGVGNNPRFFSSDENSGLLGLLEKQIGPCKNGFIASHQGISLSTVWQPIISFPHQQVVGVEALVRGCTASDQVLDCESLFNGGTFSGDRHRLEQVSRMLHLHNFNSLTNFNGWLFLNFSPSTMTLCGDSGLFTQMMKSIGVNPKQVVIEVVETGADNTHALNRTIGQLRDAGCLIALDDFGAGHSNLDRAWSLQPDIVKLDKALVHRSGVCIRTQKLLPKLVELLHQSGYIVVAEGVESVEQALLLWDSGVDMAQGNLFSKPSLQLPSDSSISSLLSSLSIQSKRKWQRDTVRRRRIFDHFAHFMKRAGVNMGRGMTLDAACRSLINQAGVRRCFILDELGGHVAETEGGRPANGAYSQLEIKGDSDWGRRSYFRKAIDHPDQVFLSRTYLSISDGELCKTMSICFHTRHGLRVLCCDIDPEFAPDTP